jgi:asparagine synthase (glutamine-hydrolysing)
MPGIVGLSTRLPRGEAENQLRQMMEALRHESSYQSGTFIEESLGIYVGWVEKKNSFADEMPLKNESGEIILVFSGEEYPDPAFKRRLKESKHRFAEHGPSYLVHASEDDPNFPAGLNGRFQGLLINKSAGTAALFNDRYGMHRIYYHQCKDAFYFAAEAKAILAVRPELRRTDPRGLGELVSCGCVLENRTVFKDVHVLPGASSWTIQNGAVQRRSAYFEAREWEQQPVLDPESYYHQLRETFSRNLPRYFESSQKIGMSLTGGLDSRLILAWWKASPETLPCYSFGGTFRDCQDVLMARRIAVAYGQKHEVIQVGQDFLSRFFHYSERTVYLTDGCADVSRSSDLFINERAAAIAPIRMTGNYGGEVLRRVRAFKPDPPTDGLFTPEFLQLTEKAKVTYEELLKVHPLSFAVFRQAPWHHYGLLALEQTQVTLRSPYLDNDLVKTIFHAPDSVLTSNDVCLRLIADGDRSLAKFRTDRGLAGDHGWFMSAALREYLEFTFKAEYAYDYGMPQWVSRVDHFFSPLHLERIFLGRHKFYHFRVWYRDVLANHVREMLLDPRTLCRPYLNRNMVEAVVAGHLKGGLNYTTAIHKILTLEHLHRLFIDSN